MVKVAEKLGFLMFLGFWADSFLLLGRKRACRAGRCLVEARGVELKAFRARFNGFTEMFAKNKGW